jgi:hypothetical protein
MSNNFETRLEVVKHISKMLLEMADVDFNKLTPDQEQVLLEDYEEIGAHLLDSMSFKVTDVYEDGSFSAVIKFIPINEYIDKVFSEEETS